MQKAMATNTSKDIEDLTRRSSSAWDTVTQDIGRNGINASNL